MAIEYRKLTDKELDVFIEMRINQLKEEGAKENIDLRPVLKNYYNRHMAESTFVSWIAVDGDKIIGTSGMSFVEKPPYLDVQAEKSDCCQACLPTPITDEWVLQENCCTELLKKQESTAAVQYRSLLLIWGLSSILHTGLFTTKTLCNISYELNFGFQNLPPRGKRSARGMLFPCFRRQSRNAPKRFCY